MLPPTICQLWSRTKGKEQKCNLCCTFSLNTPKVKSRIFQKVTFEGDNKRVNWLWKLPGSLLRHLLYNSNWIDFESPSQKVKECRKQKYCTLVFSWSSKFNSRQIVKPISSGRSLASGSSQAGSNAFQFGKFNQTKSGMKFGYSLRFMSWMIKLSTLYETSRTFLVI